jgi:hypothetical protein
VCSGERGVTSGTVHRQLAEGVPHITQGFFFAAFSCRSRRTGRGHLVRAGKRQVSPRRHKATKENSQRRKPFFICENLRTSADKPSRWLGRRRCYASGVALSTALQGGSPPQEEKPWHTAGRHALRLGVRHVTNGFFFAALVETALVRTSGRQTVKLSRRISFPWRSGCLSLQFLRGGLPQ